MIINGSIPGDPQEVAKAEARLNHTAEPATETTTETENTEQSQETKKPTTAKRGRKSSKKTADEQPADMFNESEAEG